MSSLTIDEDEIPRMEGKVVLVTGGASGIGLAASRIFESKGAKVHVVDIEEPEDDDDSDGLAFHRADVRDWRALRAVFEAVGPVHVVLANAGAASGDDDFLCDDLDAEGLLREPTYGDNETNIKGTLNTIKLAWSSMRRHGVEGSIVLTAGSPGYSPEHSLPVWSMGQSAIISLVRSLRHNVVQDNITINAVAPHATITKMLMYDLAVPMIQSGLPVSNAEHVGLALVYSATARQDRRVDVYGKEPDSQLAQPGRWHGRVILTWGDNYVELEERIADQREKYFGADTLQLFKTQQAVTDLREL